MGNSCFLFLACLTSQQRRICLDNFTRCRTEIEVADQTCYLTQLQHIDTGPASPNTYSTAGGPLSSRHRNRSPLFQDVSYQWCKVCLLVGCLTSQQHASVSLGRICSDNFTCCHTETEVADQTFYLTQSQYTDQS